MFNFLHFIYFLFTYKSTASRKNLKYVVVLVIVIIIIIIITTVKVVILRLLLHLWYYSLTYLFVIPYL